MRREFAAENERNRSTWVGENLARLPTGWRILDAGAGEQRYRSLCSHLEYVAQDFAQYIPDPAAAGLQMPVWNYGALDIVSDIASIPEPDGSFDAVLCTEVLEHVPDPLSAIHELARLLKPGGHLILTVPFCSLTHFAPHHYVPGLSRYFLELHLGDSGFRILELTSNGGFFDFIAQELCRLPSVEARYARPSRGWLRLARWLGTKLLLRYLESASTNDTGSSELLTFGFFVRAVRVDTRLSHPLPLASEDKQDK
jgi:SAM-dependent methyltransferase